MTLSIPKELHEKMKAFSEIRWSEIARRAIEQRIDDLEVMNKIAALGHEIGYHYEDVALAVKKGKVTS